MHDAIPCSTYLPWWVSKRYDRIRLIHIASSMYFGKWESLFASEIWWRYDCLLSRKITVCLCFAGIYPFFIFIFYRFLLIWQIIGRFVSRGVLKAIRTGKRINGKKWRQKVTWTTAKQCNRRKSHLAIIILRHCDYKKRFSVSSVDTPYCTLHYYCVHKVSVRTFIIFRISGNCLHHFVLIWLTFFFNWSARWHFMFPYI